MGTGSYSSTRYVAMAAASGFDTKSAQEIFSKSMNSSMNPKGMALRESRDSNEHPNSLAILLALDVTGSMQTVPHYLVKKGLPTIMDGIIQAGIPDPQVLFMGIGDHECDRFPLQVGQYESSDELLAKWLTDLWLEGGGGGNDGESYLLAWYFAGHHTSIDCWEKRKQKGFLFTVGDEPPLMELPMNNLQNIMGEAGKSFKAKDLLEQAQKTYEVYHLHIVGGTNHGSDMTVISRWKKLLGDHLIEVPYREDVPTTIAKIVAEKMGVAKPVTPTVDLFPSKTKEEIESGKK